MKRPLLPIALIYAGGILSATFLPVPLFLPLEVALCLVLAALAWSRARPVLLCLLIFLTGWTNLTLHTAIISPHDLRTILPKRPQLITARGALLATPSLRVYEHEETESWRSMALLDVTSV